MAGYWPTYFLGFIHGDENEVNNNAKTNEVNIQPSWFNTFGQKSI